MTAATAVTVPDLDAVYHLDNHGPVTLSHMFAGIDPYLISSSQTMLKGPAASFAVPVEYAFQLAFALSSDTKCSIVPSAL